LAFFAGAALVFFVFDAGALAISETPFLFPFRAQLTQSLRLWPARVAAFSFFHAADMTPVAGGDDPG